jgi:sulfotransferase
MKIYFNSSMPRSGSTLLQNILGNNPSFYATPTSGLIDYLIAAKKAYTESPIVKSQDSGAMKSAFLTFSRFGLEGYFSALTNKPYAIDKSRAWAINYDYLNSFYPNPKIVCMVRDIRDIIASMEKNFRKHPDKWDSTFSSENPKHSVYDRVNHWMNTKPVGVTYKRLQDSVLRGYAKNILFIKFEELSKNPENEMKRVYDFFELPYYAINYNNVKQVTFEDDKFHGIYGDHNIKSKIEPSVSKAKQLLGEDICDKLYQNCKWYFEYFKYSK